MSKLNQSFCLPLYLKGETSVDELAGKAKEIGFKAVEVWQRAEAPFEELVEATQKHGLVISQMSGHYSLPDGLNNPDNHNRIADELHESIDIAAENNIPGLICFSGNRNGRDDEESIEICAEGLSRALPYAEEKGINLNMELLNSKVDHPDYQCDHTEWGVRVCKAADSPRAKLLYDIYHMAIMEGDLIRTIRDNIDFIGHFHTAGNPDRGPLDENQELYYPAICRAIADTGYDLYIAHEFRSEGDPVDALQHAYTVCDV
jgi:hydroxypyruvate isomerase